MVHTYIRFFSDLWAAFTALAASYIEYSAASCIIEVVLPNR